MVKRQAGSLNVELTEGAIRVHLANKTLTILATPTPPDAEDAPDFLVSLDDLEHWDAPNDADEIGIKELQRIVQAIETEMENRGLSVEFD